MLTLIVSLVILSFILLLMELFMPSTILGGIAGGVLAIAIILSYTYFGPTAGTLLFIGSLAICCIGFVIWISIFNKTPIGRAMILPSKAKSDQDHPQYGEFLGKTGVTLTPLVPSGIVMFGGRRLDVIAESGLIDKNEKVIVTEVNGLRIVVRKLNESQYAENRE